MPPQIESETTLPFLRALLPALLLLSLAAAAQASSGSKMRGGFAFLTRIGPWYIAEATYDDGSTVCWAKNFVSGRNEPSFNFTASRGGENDSSIMRFDGLTTSKPSDTVKLVIGDKAFLMTRPQAMDAPIFVPRSIEDLRAITEALEARAGASRRSFYVVDAKGRKRQFDARQTSRMISYMEQRCAFERY